MLIAVLKWSLTQLLGNDSSDPSESRPRQEMDKDDYLPGSRQVKHTIDSYHLAGSCATSLDPHVGKAESRLTVRAPPVCRITIGFQVLWQSTNEFGRLQATTCPYICLAQDEMAQDLEGMIGIYDLVTGPLLENSGNAILHIKYPLMRPARRVIRPESPSRGFRRGELCARIAEEYAAVYELERKSGGEEGWNYDNIGPGSGRGRYGIQEHGLRDLLLGRVIYSSREQSFELEVHT